MNRYLLLSPLMLPALLFAAQNDRATISGKITNPEGTVRIVAASLRTGERFSSLADGSGAFTLPSLPAGSYRVLVRNERGTAIARRLLKVRAGESLLLNARLEAVRPARIDGRRAGAHQAAAATAASAADLPPIIQQFGESSRYLNAVVLVDDNHGWAVGDPHWSQATRQTMGTIINTSDGGVTWNDQNPGVTVSLNGLFFLNTSQGWVVGDNGTILRTTDSGAHWTQQPVSTNDSFVSVSFTDALNGWAASYAPTQYDDDVEEDPADWQPGIWHTADGGQTWAPQAVPATAMLLKRVFFVNVTTGFAAGTKRTGYDPFLDPTALGAIYGTTDGGRTWNEIYSTSQGLTFTSLYFTDALNGWAAGFALSSVYTGACAFHTSDGGKTWQGQNLNEAEAFDVQVRDLRMLDGNRGYAAGTSYLGDGTAVWRTLDGGVNWTGVTMYNTNPLSPEGYWGLAVTADRVRIVGDRDITSFSSNPWGACTDFLGDCGELFTQANISPHYIFHDVFFADRNHGWAAGARTFSPQIWGQEILATQDGGQTWTSQFEHSLPDALFSYMRLESIFFVDTHNGWAAGSSEYFQTSGGTELGCILHTADGGTTWTEQAGNICSVYDDDFPVIQFLDAQNGWALDAGYNTKGTVRMAHTTDGGNHWTLIDTGIAGGIGAGFEYPAGGMRFVDAQHGCFAGYNVVGCTSDGGAHWTKQAVNCAELCYPNSNGVAFADSLHGWIVGGFEAGLYQTADGGANWSVSPSKAVSETSLEAIQFLSPSTGWISGQGGLLFETTDAGANWKSVDSGTGIDLMGLNFTDATHGWIVGDFGAILSYAGDRNPAGMPAVFTAVNAASYANQTAPAAWTAIFGANLSVTTRSWAASDFNGNNLPTKLDGVSVLVNGAPAYVSYISPGQINAMFPDDGSTGQALVQVTNSQGSSGTLLAQKAVYSPALFRLSAERGNVVFAQTSDGDLVGNFMVGYDLAIPLQVRPAKPGEIVTLYGTGFGPTSPPLPSGSLVGTPAQLASPVTFTVGGNPAVVKWAGLIGPGLYQFNIQVPANNSLMPSNYDGADLVIVANIGGNRSQGDSVLTVRQP